MSTRDATKDAVEVVTSEAEPVSSEGAQTNQGARRRHPVNLKVTLLGRYYVAFVAGKELRSTARRMEELQKRPPDAFLGNTLVVMAIGLAIGLALYGLQLTLGMWALQCFSTTQ